MKLLIIMASACALMLAPLAAETADQSRTLQSLDASGGTDVSALIQHELDLGGTIVIPSGKYRLEGPLSFKKGYTRLLGNPGVELFIPKGTIFKDAAAITARNGADGKGISHVEVSGLALINDPENTTPGDNGNHTKGMVFDRIDGITVRSCRVENFDHDGIFAACSRNVLIEDCVTIGQRHGIVINGQWEPVGSYDAVIRNCFVKNAWDTGIIVGSYSKRTRILGNRIENSSEIGIDVFNAQDVIIADNFILDWGDQTVNSLKVPGKRYGAERCRAIWIHPDAGGVSATEWTANIVIHGNIIKKTFIESQPDKLNTARAIQINGYVNHVSVTGNNIIGGTQAISLLDTEQDNPWYPKRMDQSEPPRVFPMDIIFSGNLCDGQTGNIIDVTLGQPSDVSTLISDNVLRSDDGGLIHISPDVSNLVIRGNIIRTSLPTLLSKEIRDLNSIIPAASETESSRLLARALDANPKQRFDLLSLPDTAWEFKNCKIKAHDPERIIIVRNSWGGWEGCEALVTVEKLPFAPDSLSLLVNMEDADGRWMMSLVAGGTETILQPWTEYKGFAAYALKGVEVGDFKIKIRGRSAMASPYRRIQLGAFQIVNTDPR